ncbi:AfsR/SARP family transcriptional regulator [Actinoplanes sp. TBRC 11911]|uniref:BTAD domain-containing putative transcriptional regulator n=1 Tax=Actinoplanes sp. TBRC 11911 TaxID=2729386 RepID=UPI00145F327F|nr:BTAD domain-containing putative transcriptional regulator [Actinoplanes sp. TBRC 11911]NMO53872.1 AfsR/SARP family transcriptional regulator [Actinoplanes sp. TBRC 11911]
MQISMLGPLEVRIDDSQSVDVPGARLRGLLVALALEAGRVVPKSVLVDWLWGESPPADAANALQRLVSRLRKTLPEGSIDGQAGGYRLAIDPDAVDAVRFERLVDRARGDEGQVKPLREALALWRGAAMQDVGLQEGAAFDAAVARLEGLRLAAMEDRFDAEAGAELVGELTDAVAANPVRERLAGALMRALVAAGRGSEALLVYQRTREALADELGVDPSPELAALHVALLKGELAPPREENRKTNLRAELTSFIGRDADVAAVGELVGEHRLVTLVGPGGSGKTRLATETARTLLGDLPDGAWLVELAAIGADGDVAQSTLAGLGLREALLGGAPNADPTDRLIAAIREREALLILDNCEHVIESAAAFAQRVLGECRRLRILATSREPLGITGEALWLVEPLALPEAPAEIESSPAVQLLRDRASAVRKDLGADALPTMARVCRVLDGMPLAIELAAARLRTMSLEQLADRLDDRFRLLTSGSRTVLPRHRTLRAVVDWSWELLTDAERAVLRRLAVFAGGVSLEAAERVCAGDTVHPEGGTVPDGDTVQDGGTVHPDEVLELLTSLTEKSLLLTGGDGDLRYRMIGTIKEYAAYRLAEAGEADVCRRAHLAWFTELAEAAEQHLRRAEQLDWLARLGVEHDNITAAMRGALAAGAAQEAMRLAAGAGWYWWLSGHRGEGVELLMAAADLPGDVTDDIKAAVYTLIVHFLTSGRGDERTAAEWIHEAYRVSLRSESRHPTLAFAAPLERLLQAPEEALTAFEPLLEHEDPWVRALAGLQTGKMRVVTGHGGPEVDAYLEKALAEFRVLGERFGMWFALIELADRLTVRGEFAAACEHLERAVVAVIELGTVEEVISIRARQAQLYRLLGDKEAGAAAIADAQRWAERVTWPGALAELALAKAELARSGDDPAEARRQLDVALGLLGEDAEQASIRATAHDLLGYLADDLGESRAHRKAAYQAATESGYPLMIARILVGVADLALRGGQDEQAVRLLAAGDALRGLPDLANPDAARIERTVRQHLGDARYAALAQEGAGSDWSELVASVA